MSLESCVGAGWGEGEGGGVDECVHLVRGLRHVEEVVLMKKRKKEAVVKTVLLACCFQEGRSLTRVRF